MGMCKGCGQIFKTEEMIHNFCMECQKTEKFESEKILIESGQKRKEQLKDKSFFIIIASIVCTIFILPALFNGNYFIALLIGIIPLIGLYTYLKEIYLNNKLIKSNTSLIVDKVNSESNKIKMILAKEWIILVAFILLSIICGLIFELNQKTYCYKVYTDTSSLSNVEIEVNNFILNDAKGNLLYLDDNIKKVLTQKSKNFPNIIQECNKNFSSYFATINFLDIETRTIILYISYIYLLLLILRIFIFTTIKSIDIIKKDKK